MSESPTEQAIRSFIYLARTQAFIDGNKRSSSLFANYILIKNGCGYFTIPENHLTEFRNKLVKYYESLDEDIVDFIYENCIYAGHSEKLRDLKWT